MRQKNRHKSEVDKFHKQKHHGDTGYDIRIQKRNIGRAEINGLVPFFHGGYAERGKCSDQCGNNCGQESDLQSCDKCSHNLFVLKTAGIPPEREATPFYLGTGIVERQSNQHNNRKVKEGKNQDHIDPGCIFF